MSQHEYKQVIMIRWLIYLDNTELEKEIDKSAIIEI